MERIQFTISINAPVATVYSTMIGRETFKRWTSYLTRAQIMKAAILREHGTKAPKYCL
jgi:hypothetical protein